MTTASQAVARIREALEKGPTPGPWAVYSQPVANLAHAIMELAELVKGSDFRPILPMVVDGELGLCTATTGCGPTSDANAAYIAACSPDSLRAILDDIAAKDREIERLRVDAERWRVLDTHTGSATFNLNRDQSPKSVSHVKFDAPRGLGTRLAEFIDAARAALAAAPGGEGATTSATSSDQ